MLNFTCKAWSVSSGSGLTPQQPRIETMSRVEVMFGLLDEIRQMEDTVLYLNNRIMRKHIALAELMEGLGDQPQDDSEIEAAPRHNIPWREFLDTRNGQPFGRSEMAHFAIDHKNEGNLTKRISVQLNDWLRQGRIRRIGLGLFQYNSPTLILSHEPART